MCVCVCNVCVRACVRVCLCTCVIARSETNFCNNV